MSALANEHQAINLSQGFPNYPCSEKLIGLVNDYMKKGFNQYAPMTGMPALRKVIAQKIENLFDCVINADQEITVTAGATQAIYTAISALIRPGDEVIIFEPAYDSYAPSIEVNGGKVVRYALSAPNYEVDWELVESKITSKTKLIITNTPHNPTGSILKENDLLALQELVNKHDLFLLSDEVYEHLIYDGQAHQSVFKYPDLYKRSFVTFSFGKTLHATGWKIGYCVAPPLLTKEFRKVHQFNVFSVNAPKQLAIADFLQDEKEYLGLNQFFEKKRDFFLNTIEGSKFRPLKCAGTYFQLLDYSKISDLSDVDFAKKLTTENGVAVIPVSAFHENGKDEKVIRVCFAKNEETLLSAGEILRKV